jgi:AcrR family transcriptional regulator
MSHDGRMVGHFSSRTRERLREEILDAAAAEVVARGWRGLRMQAVADAVGVSRQTVHNEFTTKQGLASSLALHIAARYCDEHEIQIANSTDVVSAMRDTVRRGLEEAAEDPVFKTVMTPESSDTFLPLYTSDSAPLVQMFTERLSSAWLRRWPELDPDRLRIVMTAATRLVLSHILLPIQPPEQVADDAAALLGGFLLDSSPPPAS